MKQALHLMLYFAVLVIMGCTGKDKNTGNSREPQASDTLYTWRAAMQVYGYQPEKGVNIDSGIAPTYELDKHDFFDVEKVTQLIQNYYAQ